MSNQLLYHYPNGGGGNTLARLKKKYSHIRGIQCRVYIIAKDPSLLSRMMG